MGHATTSIATRLTWRSLERGALRVELDAAPVRVHGPARGPAAAARLPACGSRTGTVARPLRPVHRGRRRARGARRRRARAARERRARATRRRDRARGHAAGRPRATAARSTLVDDDRIALELHAEGEPLRLAPRLGPALRGAVRRARRPPRHAAGPGGPADPARRRPPLHRPRLPARDARRRAASRRATARRAVADLEPRLRRCGCGPRPTAPASTGGRAGLGLDARARPARCGWSCCARPTPAARLRAFCRLTGFPALLPEWAYGFWKSRDVHEHQDDVLDDFDGFRRHGIPLDAIVIDSPWATQYNTWEFNPHQFPDARGMIRRLRARRRAHGRVGARRGSTSTRATARSRPSPNRSGCTASPPPTTRQAAAAGHFVRDAERRAVRRRSGGWAPARRSTSPARRPSGGGASRPSACSSSASRGSRPTTARATTSPTTSGSPTGAAAPQAAWALGGLHRDMHAARARRGPPGQRRAVRPQRLDRPARRPA